MQGFWINQSSCNVRIPRIGKRFRPERPQSAVDEAAQRPGIEGGVQELPPAVDPNTTHLRLPYHYVAASLSLCTIKL